MLNFIGIFSHASKYKLIFPFGLQNVAVEAFKHFVLAYLGKTTNKGAYDITTKYLEHLTDANVAVRRGSALAIGSLPIEFLVTKWKSVLSKLCNSCAVEVTFFCFVQRSDS